jgi:hypothetical protein
MLLSLELITATTVNSTNNIQTLKFLVISIFKIVDKLQGKLITKLNRTCAKKQH